MTRVPTHTASVRCALTPLEHKLKRAALAAALRIDEQPPDSVPRSRALAALTRSLRSGACVSSRLVSLDTFYPRAEDDDDAARVEAAAAFAICAVCPVRARCLAVALLTDPGRHGIWGGLPQGERRKLRAEFEIVKVARECARDGREPRDLLADVADLIADGTDAVYLSALTYPLRRLAPSWPLYRRLRVERLADLLELHGVPTPRNDNGVKLLRPRHLHAAIADRRERREVVA